MNRVLQLNLDGKGGAFSLMSQVQEEIKDRVVFDYYTMGKFENSNAVQHIQDLGGKIIEGGLRHNRLLGHFLLPFDFYKTLKASKYDIVHIHADTSWKLLLYALPAKVAGIKKVIIHAHSSAINGDHKFIKKICHYIAKPILPKFADIYLTCSDLATNWIYPSKYHNKVRLIKNGISCDRYTFSLQERNRVRNELDLSSNAILIGVIGDMSYTKNPEFILEVFKRVHEINNNYYLIFIGDGLDKENIEMSVSKSKIKENVIFYGRTNNVPSVLSAMDIYAMPSKFEGLPVSAVEAQANGLPTILSNRITRNVKILDNCQFIGIESNNVEIWVSSILNMKLDFRKRITGADIVKMSGFNISDTSKEVIDVYGS